jgi:isomerase DpgB
MLSDIGSYPDAGLGPQISIDGGQRLSADLVTALGAVCDQAEDLGGTGIVVVRLSGAPQSGAASDFWTRDLTVGLVSKWERGLRRLERLGMTTVAVAAGDCGGVALDALLATDYRIASGDLRLLLPAQGGTTWPGMAIYRLAQQAGVARVRRSVLFGHPIDAAEALDLRLVDEIADDMTADGALLPGVAGGLSVPELAIRRRLLLDAATASFDTALGAHLAACDRELRRNQVLARS